MCAHMETLVFLPKKKKGSPIKFMFLDQPNAYPHDDWILNSREMSVLENLQPFQLETISHCQGNSALFDSTLL